MLAVNVLRVIFSVENCAHSRRLASVSAFAGKWRPSKTRIGLMLCVSSIFTYFKQYKMCLKAEFIIMRVRMSVGMRKKLTHQSFLPVPVYRQQQMRLCATCENGKSIWSLHWIGNFSHWNSPTVWVDGNGFVGQRLDIDFLRRLFQKWKQSCYSHYPDRCCCSLVGRTVSKEFDFNSSACHTLRRTLANPQTMIFLCRLVCAISAGPTVRCVQLSTVSVHYLVFARQSDPYWADIHWTEMSLAFVASTAEHGTTANVCVAMHVLVHMKFRNFSTGRTKHVPTT